MALLLHACFRPATSVTAVSGPRGKGTNRFVWPQGMYRFC